MRWKLFIIICTQFWSHLAYSSEIVNDPYINLLRKSGFTSFLNQVSQFQKIDKISEVDEVDYQLKIYFSSKQFWKDFETKKYEKILLNKLRNHFSKVEVDLILIQFEKPFMQNIFKQLVFKFDYFDFLDTVIDTNFKTKPNQKDMFLLFKNSFKLYGLSIQTDILSTELKIYADENKVDVNYYSLKEKEIRSISSKIMKRRIKNLQNFFIEYWASKSQLISKPELREHTRIWEKNRIGQKFLQFAANYHFLFIHSHFRNLEKRTK